MGKRPSVSLTSLRWLVEMGVDEGVSDNPINRFARGEEPVSAVELGSGMADDRVGSYSHAIPPEEGVKRKSVLAPQGREIKNVQTLQHLKEVVENFEPETERST